MNRKRKKGVQSVALQPLDTAQRYTVEEALAYLRTSRATLYHLISDKNIKILKEGKRTFVPGSEIARLSSVAAAV